MSVTLSHIDHSFGDTRILSDLSLHAASGDIACLLGPSGCGKTTLLRLIAGLEPLQHGEITIDDAPVAHDTHGPDEPHDPDETHGRDHQSGGVAMVFQDFLLFPHMTAAQNVAFGLTGPKAERARRAAAELDMVGLGDYARRFPHELSGGQQQRVALARAFARDPALILLDEPFASIDAALRRRLRASLRGLLKARRATAIVVTHDPEEALDLADRIAIMGEGRILEEGTPRDLYEAPRTLEAASIFPGAQETTLRFLAELGALDDCAMAEGASSADDAAAPVVLLAGALTVHATPPVGNGPDADHHDDQGRAMVHDCRFSGPDFMVSVGSVDGAPQAPRSRAPTLPRLRAKSASALEPGTRVRLSLDMNRLRRF